MINGRLIGSVRRAMGRRQDMARSTIGRQGARDPAGDGCRGERRGVPALLRWLGVDEASSVLVRLERALAVSSLLLMLVSVWAAIALIGSAAIAACRGVFDGTLDGSDITELIHLAQRADLAAAVVSITGGVTIMGRRLLRRRRRQRR